jgi:membrane-bound metal-dependent hydrolase YbcI (DUF457 family)
MDPLTHIVVGRAVVAAAGRDIRQSAAIGVAAILGALSPDADSAVGFWGWDRYLRVHQSGTHSLLGALTMAGLTAGLVRRFAPRSRYGALAAAAAAGAVSHVALDLASGARIAVGWPLWQRRVSLPLVAMADPWLLGICVAGLVAVWPGRAQARTAARLVLGAMTLFLVFKASMFAVAIRRTNIQLTEPSAIEGLWGSLTDWRIYERTPDAVRSTAISSASQSINVLMSVPLEPDSPLVTSSRALDTVENFLAVHEFAFPVVTSVGDGQTSVFWTDLRYCAPAAPDGSIGCGVWAGGVFDSSAHALKQEVKVGLLVQTRQLPE